jgi:hypothetical protein
MTNPISKLTDHPGYNSAKSKLAEIQSELSAVGKQIAETSDKLRTPDCSLEYEANALLAGDNLQTKDIDSLEKSLAELMHRQSVLVAAVEIQKREIANQQEAASKDICRHFGPQWVELAKNIRDSARKLAQSAATEWTLRQDLSRSGVAIYAPLSYQAGIDESLIYRLNYLADTIDKVL